MQLFIFIAKLRSSIVAALLQSGFAVAGICFAVMPICAQRTNPKETPVVVQPGAPGQPTRVLPPTTKGKLPQPSPKDVEFMQGMIMHHGQAVEMTALIAARTENRAVRLIGAKISQSQSDEMNFMKRWLEARGEKNAMPMNETPETAMSDMPAMQMPGMNPSQRRDMHRLMPGMLSPEQMAALKNAKGAEFDRLFLSGMIQHHEGALEMVKELFGTAGAGQDAELFNFTTDVDTGQRAEIEIMQKLLDAEMKKEKQ